MNFPSIGITLEEFKKEIDQLIKNGKGNWRIEISSQVNAYAPVKLNPSKTTCVVYVVNKN